MDLDSIIEEYESLPETDKSKIEAFEDVVKAKTKKTTAKRAVIISIICILAISLSVAIIILRIRKRKRLKASPRSKGNGLLGQVYCKTLGLRRA
jgi:hypothetical protein